MAKKEKKIDLKKLAKVDLSKAIAGFLEEAGYEVIESAEDFGFTEGTLIVREESTDVQVKFITPKAGVIRYEKAEETEEVPTSPIE